MSGRFLTVTQTLVNQVEKLKNADFWSNFPNKSRVTLEPLVGSNWGMERWMRVSELERMPKESV